MGISIGQLIVILIIVAILFGTKKLRNIGGDLGSAIKSFRDAYKDSETNADVKDSASKHGTVIEGETKSETESDNKPS